MADEWTAKLLQHFQNASVKLGKKKSALRPYLAFCSLITPLAFVLAWIAKDNVIAWGFLGAGLIPVVATSIVGVRLAIKNPDTLRSEEWQTREQIINLMLQKGKPFAIDLASLENMANPERARLAQPQEIEPTKAEEIQ
jgi:hypothetical protein